MNIWRYSSTDLLILVPDGWMVKWWSLFGFPQCAVFNFQPPLARWWLSQIVCGRKKYMMILLGIEQPFSSPASQENGWAIPALSTEITFYYRIAHVTFSYHKYTQPCDLHHAFKSVVMIMPCHCGLGSLKVIRLCISWQLLGSHW